MFEDWLTDRNVLFYFLLLDLFKKNYSKEKKTEAVGQRCSVKKVFLEVSQNS